MSSNKNNILFVREYHEHKENGVLTLEQKRRKRIENAQEHTIC